VLVIQATRVSDSGTYTCTIYTVTGDYQSKEARITVTQRPVTLPGNMIVYQLDSDSHY